MRSHDLWELMTKQGTPIMYYKGQPYILCAIEREDGSGNSFNLKLRKEDDYHNTINVHVITTS